jgi:myo-inositol 2-dehydrogenase/D-chiro-inositol 1-dehydrogenase
MPLQIGFIGMGGIANTHLKALNQMAEEVRLVAFCDTDSSRAEATAQAYGGRAYTNYEQMLDSEKLDAVYICVPPHAHVGQEEALAARGIPFFVEKPIANNLEKARAIAEVVDRAHLITSVGYHFRYMTYTNLARERLEGQTIGMALGYWMGGMPGVFWWRRKEMSGGQFVEQTTHIVDLARYLCGEIEEVYAAMSTRALGEVENFDVADVGTVTVKFEGGAVGTIANTCLLKGFGYTVGLHVVTPHVIVEVDSSQFRAIQAGREEIVRGGNNPYLEEDRTFIRAIQTGDPSPIRSPYADAVKTLAVTLAANRSAETGEPVAVEL